jgi:hypothetical protein
MRACLAGQVPNFLFHHQADQRQAGLSQQVADAVYTRGTSSRRRYDGLPDEPPRIELNTSTTR